MEYFHNVFKLKAVEHEGENCKPATRRKHL
jgi:hypothetical protein